MVADIKDKFRRRSDRAGQNLFALHPFGARGIRGRRSIFEQILDVEEAFTRVDYLTWILRPQKRLF